MPPKGGRAIFCNACPVFRYPRGRRLSAAILRTTWYYKVSARSRNTFGMTECLITMQVMLNSFQHLAYTDLKRLGCTFHYAIQFTCSSLNFR